jgi:hypothetical protein
MPSSRRIVLAAALRMQPGFVDRIVDDALVARPHAVGMAVGEDGPRHADQRGGAPGGPPLAAPYFSKP